MHIPVFTSTSCWRWLEDVKIMNRSSASGSLSQWSLEAQSPVMSSSWRECGFLGLWAARVQHNTRLLVSGRAIRAFMSSDRGAAVKVKIWLGRSLVLEALLFIVWRTCSTWHPTVSVRWLCSIMITETLGGLESSIAIHGAGPLDTTPDGLVHCFGNMFFWYTRSHPKGSSVHCASIRWFPSQYIQRWIVNKSCNGMPSEGRLYTFSESWPRDC